MAVFSNVDAVTSVKRRVSPRQTQTRGLDSLQTPAYPFPRATRHPSDEPHAQKLPMESRGRTGNGNHMEASFRGSQHRLEDMLLPEMPLRLRG